MDFFKTKAIVLPAIGEVPDELGTICSTAGLKLCGIEGLTGRVVLNGAVSGQRDLRLELGGRRFIDVCG